jgi:hypothetical protein
MKVSIVASDDDLLGYLGGTEKQVNQALMRAVNRVASKAKTISKRAITKQAALKDRFVGEKLSLTKASPGNLEAVIHTPKKGLSLSHYKHAQAFERGRGKKGKRAGVRVTVKPGITKIIKKAFLMKGSIKMRYGGRMHTLFGPSVSQIWNKTRETLRPELNHDLRAITAEELRFIVTGSRR